MNRKQFIESTGATCRNWTWSWSFVNHTEKFVIFGAWDVYEEGNNALILNEDWAWSNKGKKQAAYAQSREHIRLVEEKQYQLKTFPMEYTKADADDETAPAKIKGFTPRLANKVLIRIDRCWYASDEVKGIRLPEELDPSDALKEGAARTVSVNQYERNAEARRKCIEHHGCRCAVCSFDFEGLYGAIGKGYIHVHHVVPLADIGKEYVVDPINDLVPICPNCHAMIHSTRPALAIAQLRRHLAKT
jgi:5-methylcytosine-specific restriction protein A